EPSQPICYQHNNHKECVMSYKTILVHVDNDERTKERIRIAAKIALAEKAYLIGASMTGVSKFLSQGAILNNKDQYLRRHIELSKERAVNALEALERIAREIGVK